MTQISKRNNSNSIDIAVSDFKNSDITLYGTPLPEGIELTSRESKILQTINYAPVRTINRNNLIDMVFVIVSNALRALQSKMKAEDILLLTNDITNEIEEDHPGLSIKEVELIIREGIRGKFNTEKRTTVGLSVVNFNVWIGEYCAEKNKINLEIQKKAELIKKPVDDKEITIESTMDVIMPHYVHLKKQYNSAEKEVKDKFNFHEYFIRTALHTSGNLIFSHLKKLNAVNYIEFKKELNKLIDNNYAPKDTPEFERFGEAGLLSRKNEAKRIYCCKYFLSVINK